MPAQLSFAEFDPPQPVEQVVFFALYPDSQTAERVAVLVQRLRERLGLKGSALKTELFHTTLFALGNTLRLSTDREFDHVASFGGRARKHPFVLHGGNGLEKWKDFQRQLGTAALKAGAVQSLPAYAPHMTLLYDEHSIPSQEIEPIRWTAREFSLVRSIHGEGRHEPIERWPLCG
jgi:RNA 2',3'-cyclic 3'-phosphodiesterase